MSLPPPRRMQVMWSRMEGKRDQLLSKVALPFRNTTAAQEGENCLIRPGTDHSTVISLYGVESTHHFAS